MGIRQREMVEEKDQVTKPTKNEFNPTHSGGGCFVIFKVISELTLSAMQG